MPKLTVDAVVIGAGAAGLLAATRAAERGKQTLLLERNRKPGVKILMSGGTRCNLTHAIDPRGIVEAFGKKGAFLHSALAALPPDDLVALIEAEGVPTKIEETGKIFPASDRAADVLEALLSRLERSGATLAKGEAVLDISRVENQQFQIEKTQRTISAKSVVLTTGGQSYPGCGTQGDGYRWAANFGHTIIEPRPSLVPLTIRGDWAKSLRGVAVPEVEFRISEQAGSSRTNAKPLDTRSGAMLFTHFGLSGPAVLDISRAVTLHGSPRSLMLTCDFLPAMTSEALDANFKDFAAQQAKKQVAAHVAQWLPRRLADALLAQSGIPSDRRGAELGRDERARVIATLKATQFPITGTLGFEKAEVTTGGISLAEVDSRTMQSKKVPGLFLAGEILDLDGPIGGYNFQAAFSTGWLAGESVCG